MRREGYELAVGKPEVIIKKIGGVDHEPYEFLVVDVPHGHIGPVMELVGARRGEMSKMDVKGAYAHLEFLIPARGLIGLRTRLMSATQGEAIMHHNFHDYRPLKGEIPSRGNGVMVSMARGPAVAFSLDNLQQRGTMFVQPGDEIYVGMIIAENARNEDMAVNPCKEKKLTNMRASGSDKNILLKPPRQLTLEIALEYIEADELVEITPSKIRLRKKVLSEEGRKRVERGAARRSASRARAIGGRPLNGCSRLPPQLARSKRSPGHCPGARRGPRASVARWPGAAATLPASPSWSAAQ